MVEGVWSEPIFSSGIVTSLSKQQVEDIIMRFTATHVHFIRPTFETSVQFRLSCTAKREQLFNEYKMEGYSAEENEIYLKMKIENLKTVMSHVERSSTLHIQLSGGSPTIGTCFLVTIETPLLTSANVKRKITHQVPITVVAHKLWSEFKEFELPRPTVSIMRTNHLVY